MKDFIIERELENVKNSKTREYLNEVVSSYENGNYRAATVVLYSVVIFDLLEKLRVLMEIYNDDTAKSILEKIQELQKSKPRDPIWEKVLIEEISKRTQLLNSVEVEKLQHLAFDRNVAAHPLYDNNYKLINPNREQVRANIRNAFESVFIKEAFLSKNILKSILEESDEYCKLVNRNSLNKHLRMKYFTRLTPGVKVKLFRDLWKIAFFLDNEECNKNREVTLEVLISLIEDSYHLLYREFDGDLEYYSNIKPSNLKIDIDEWLIFYGFSRVTAIIHLLSYFPQMFYRLSETAKRIIEVEAKKNITLFIHAYFLSDNPSLHFEEVRIMHRKIYISNNFTDTAKYDCIMGWELKEIYIRTLNIDDGKAVLDYSIEYFGKSPSYSNCISIFNNMITGLMQFYNEVQFCNLLSKMNSNSQIYENHELRHFLELIKDKMNILGLEYDISPYENL